jgi:hypothetical protein
MKSSPRTVGTAPASWPASCSVRFTDRLPTPLRGSVAGVPVSLHVWPGDVIPSHPDAFRPRSGVLAGFWVLVRFP